MGHQQQYDRVVTELRAYYDQEAEQRDEDPYYPAWKAEERGRFLQLLRAEGKRTLLEVGSGPGRDGLFFRQGGMEVVCTDLSPEMVRLCREKGLTAYSMDFLRLDLPAQSFDAVHALNCLLHVPTASLPDVLKSIHALLKRGGLFYLGVYGGIEREGTWPDDPHTAKRFFAYHSDERMRELVRAWFEVVSFRPVPVERDATMHFQSFILRRRP